jgi:hypothetical protein
LERFLTLGIDNAKANRLALHVGSTQEGELNVVSWAVRSALGE